MNVWTGLRPVSPDGVPYIGKRDAWDNLLINTGHTMMGLSPAWVSSKILTDMFENKKISFNTEIPPQTDLDNSRMNRTYFYG